MRSLGDRMKRYEGVFNQQLHIKTPVILRIDGKAFHTFSRGLRKPFDVNLVDTMAETMKELCNNIQGAKFGYTQSDEMSILLTDWDSYETKQWFDYKIQKICSITASMATAIFNKKWKKNVQRDSSYYLIDEDTREWTGYKFMNRLAMFDCRCFNLPMHEVPNYFIWRQQDWIRNSVQMLARSVFSPKELHRKNQEEMKKMLLERDRNWDILDHHLQYGTSVYKELGKWVYDSFIFQEDRHFFTEEILQPEP